MKKKVLLLSINALLVVALFLTACSSTNTTKPTLQNTTWVLQSYGQPGNLRSVITSAGPEFATVEITLGFDKVTGQVGPLLKGLLVGGSTGFNDYSGIYELNGSKLSITMGFRTAVGGPAIMMDQETIYWTLLESAESYQIKDGQLQIKCGGQVLIFTQKK